MQSTRTQADWKALIEKYDNRPDSQDKESFCKQEGIEYHNITYWRKKLGLQVRGGGTAKSASVPAPAVSAGLNVATILADSKRQLTEGRKSLEKRKAELLAQIEATEAAIREIDETLAKLG